MKMRLQEGDREFEHLFITNIDLTFGFLNPNHLIASGWYKLVAQGND